MARPREAENAGGTLLGAAVGTLLLGPAGLAAGLAGAAIGAALGTAGNPQRPLPLATAVERYVTAKGLQFVSLRREARNRARVVFGAGRNNYFYVLAALPPNKVPSDPVKLDDQLYDRFTRKLDAWLRK